MKAHTGLSGNESPGGHSRQRRRPSKSQMAPADNTHRRRVEPRPPHEHGSSRLCPDVGYNGAGSTAKIPVPSAWVTQYALLLLLLMSTTFFQMGGMAEARSLDFSSYGAYGNTQDNEWRITCYTCMNVSNNEECNRYAIDRPCPEGREYCLTLHVMDGLELDRSVLVNKRCAYLDECIGDSTGCTSVDGQTQCVSCCDQPYCNDYVPSNETSAMFHRSTASRMLDGGHRTNGHIWMLISFAALLQNIWSPAGINLLS